jgi:hypothetical protein
MKATGKGFIKTKDLFQIAIILNQRRKSHTSTVKSHRGAMGKPPVYLMIQLLENDIEKVWMTPFREKNSEMGGENETIPAQTRDES